MTIILIIFSIVTLGTVALILGLCRAAADTRTVDDGRAFGGDE